MENLISGKEALIALANGDDVEFHNKYQDKWHDAKGLRIREIEGEYFVNSDDHERTKTRFRLKSRTITLNGIEVPAPFEPKEGEKYYYLWDCNDAYGFTEFMNSDPVIIGAWRTEEEIKQVVAALRTVFKGAA